MPELPEVENIRRALLPLVRGKKILDIEILKKRIIQGDVNKFKNTLIGRTFKDISRIGKYLFFHFDQDIVIVSHLRMEGKYIILEKGEPLTSHARVLFRLSDNTLLVYDDSRQFGLMILSDEKSYMNLKEIKKLGPEPFAAKPIDIYEKFQGTSRPIKTVLLDQTFMTGLGNIYVDEVLFLNKIHPLTRTNLLTLPQVERVIKTSIDVLNASIELGGSTVRSYQFSKDQIGEFQNFLKVYGKAGNKCVSCGHLLKKIKVSGRGTTYCPFEQINPEAPLVIGITGTIASGKTTLLNSLGALGYSTISSDQIVHQLYEQMEVKTRLNKIFSSIIFDDQGEVNRAQLANSILAEPLKKKELEKYIHPLVKEKITGIIAKTPAKTILFVEVPLLFEAGFEDLFNFVVGVIAPPERQLANLEIRGDNLLFAKQMIAQSKFPRYLNQLDLLILNDGSKKDLLAKLETFVKPILKQLK
ncbi:MAG: DNA-formamidopyrimidine glycosylase [Bacilli bacterium]